VPDARVELSPDASPDARDYRVTCAKLAERLGVEPRWDVWAGAPEHYLAYRAAEMTFEEVEGPRYLRLRQIASLRERGILAPSPPSPPGHALPAPTRAASSRAIATTAKSRPTRSRPAYASRVRRSAPSASRASAPARAAASPGGTRSPAPSPRSSGTPPASVP